MKHLLFFLFLIPALAFGQNSFLETLSLKVDFGETVKDGMKKYFGKHKTNDFFNKNLNKQPIASTDDSIVYQLKFLTRAAGSYLWDGRTSFKKEGSNLIISISDIKLYKKKGTSIDTIDKPIDQLDSDPLVRANVEALQKEIQKFFKYFK